MPVPFPFARLNALHAVRHSHNFFIPNTRAYQVSGLAELFPQHRQVPFLMWNEHLQEVIDKSSQHCTSSLQKTNPYHVPHHGQSVCTTPCCTNTLFDALITQIAPSPSWHSINTIWAPNPTNCGTKGGTKSKCPQQTIRRRPKQSPNTHQDYWCSSHHERSHSHSKAHFEVE